MTDQEIDALQRENAQLRGKLQASAQPAVASLDDVRKVIYEAIASADCPAIAAAARALVARAESRGWVLTVEQVPRWPLAMGNYETVVSVRPMRERA